MATDEYSTWPMLNIHIRLPLITISKNNLSEIQRPKIRSLSCNSSCNEIMRTVWGIWTTTNKLHKWSDILTKRSELLVNLIKSMRNTAERQLNRWSQDLSYNPKQTPTRYDEFRHAPTNANWSWMTAQASGFKYHCACIIKVLYFLTSFSLKTFDNSAPKTWLERLKRCKFSWWFLPIPGFIFFGWQEALSDLDTAFSSFMFSSTAIKD